MPDSRSFEERVFARFDALESQLSDVRERLERLEQKAYDTKPIWERALAEILALGDRMHTLERKFNVLGRDMLTLRGDQERIEDRMERLESKPMQ
jgi:predicted  nucleic acid-binding Zn-ribbon protein